VTASGRAVGLAAAAVGAALLTAAPSVRADERLLVERTLERWAEFSLAGCGATDTQEMTLPRRAQHVVPSTPPIGTALRDVDRGLIYGRVVAVATRRTTGRWIATFTAQGTEASCDTLDPVTGRSGEMRFAVSYSRREKVYVTGTGRGDSRSYKPKVLPFGARSAVIGLSWRRWGTVRAIGRGAVEYNNCIPNCAEARPAYYPVRVVLSRRRMCAGSAQYIRFRFRYTTDQRPEGLQTTYQENFGRAIC
jgi:hypothetical protein